MAGTGLFSRRAAYPASVPVGRGFVRQEAAEESMANPIASGGPTALGRPARAGYQDSSRKGVPAEGAAGALGGKQREREAGTMPAECPLQREIQIGRESVTARVCSDE